MLKQITTGSVFILSAVVFSQVGIQTETPKATLDVVGSPADASKLDGIIAPRLTGEELRAKDYTTNQTGALVYVSEGDATPAGQTIDVTSPGYYYFNGIKWVIAGAGDMANIYNSNDTFTANRTATIPSGQWLNFAGSGNVGIGGVSALAKLNVNGFIQFGPTDSHYGVGRVFNDANGEKYGLTQSAYFPVSGAARSPGTRVYTSGSSGVSGHISFGKYTGPTTYIEWARFSHNNGNLGINTISDIVYNNPTERLDVNGITRLRNLPMNGSVNAHHTLTGGGASSSQNQTFTATRTVVADENGILGYVNGIPVDPGIPKIVVSIGVPGTQNIQNATSPSVTAEFTNKNIDTYNAWANNVFTVPIGMGGVYIINMQNSNNHAVIESGNWHSIAVYEKSSDGGSTWGELLKDTRSYAGTNIDNGNSLYWTGSLNVGDKIRVRFNCSASTPNIVSFGSISITKLAQ